MTIQVRAGFTARQLPLDMLGTALLTAALGAAAALVATVSLMGAALVILCAAGAYLLLAARENVVEKLALMYIFLTPLQFALFSPSLFPQRDESFGFRASLSDFVFPALLLSIAMRRPGKDSVLRSRVALPLAALLLALTLSWLQSIAELGGATRFSTGKFVGLLYLIALAGALIEALRERVLWERAFDALALSGVAFGLIGVAGWLALQVFGVSTYLVDFDRVNSTMFGDANIFASLMAVALVMTVARLHFSSNRSRRFWGACAGIVLIALILSQSRSGYLAAIVGVVLLSVWLRPPSAALILSALVLFGAMAWFGAASLGISAKTALPDENRLSAETLDSRLEFWKTGLRLLRTESLSGIGIGTFQQTNFFEGSVRVLPGFARAHNSYLSVALELGLPGVLAFAFLATAAGKAAREGWRLFKQNDRWLLAAAVSSLVSMLAFAVWVDALYQRHLWILLALVLAAPNVARRPGTNGGSPSNEAVAL